MGLFGFLEDVVKGDKAKADSKKMADIDNARRQKLKESSLELKNKTITRDKNRTNPHKDKSLGSSSFKGVQFFVDSIETEFGRRITVHQFPYQDIPYSEDVGRLPRTFVVNAHVVDTVEFVKKDVTQYPKNKGVKKVVEVGVGKTRLYEIQRDKLIEAIETKGKGKFIHPTMGEYLVVPLSCSVVFDNTQGSVETFRITFKEAGELKPPKEDADTKGAVRDAELKTSTISIGNFIENYETKRNKPDWFDALLSGDINSLFDKIRGSIGLGEKDTEGFGEYFDKLDKAQKAVNTLVNLPTELAIAYQTLLSEVNNVFTNPFTKLENAFSLFNFNTSQQLNSDSAFLIGGGTQKPVLDPGTGKIVYVDVVRTENEQIAQGLREVLEDYQKEILLVNLADLIITTSYESTAQAIEYKDRINDAFDEMILNRGDSGKTGANDAYLALMDLKSKVNSDLALRIEDLPNVREVEVKSVKPVLTIAYNEYDDSTRYLEIALRNGIDHNLRTPIGEIEVIK